MLLVIRSYNLIFWHLQWLLHIFILIIILIIIIIRLVRLVIIIIIILRWLGSTTTPTLTTTTASTMSTATTLATLTSGTFIFCLTNHNFVRLSCILLFLLICKYSLLTPEFYVLSWNVWLYRFHISYTTIILTWIFSSSRHTLLNLITPVISRINISTDPNISTATYNFKSLSFEGFIFCLGLSNHQFLLFSCLLNHFLFQSNCRLLTPELHMLWNVEGCFALGIDVSIQMP